MAVCAMYTKLTRILKPPNPLSSSTHKNTINHQMSVTQNTNPTSNKLPYNRKSDIAAISSNWDLSYFGVTTQ